MSDLNMSHGKVSDFVSFPLLMFTLGAIHKGCPHIRGGGGQAKVEKCGQGEGVVSQMWTSAWKKKVATIFVKFTQIIWQYVCIYKIFILLVFNRECMERNVITSF